MFQPMNKWLRLFSAAIAQSKQKPVGVGTRMWWCRERGGERLNAHKGETLGPWASYTTHCHSQSAECLFKGYVCIFEGRWRDWPTEIVVCSSQHWDSHSQSLDVYVADFSYFMHLGLFLDVILSQADRQIRQIQSVRRPVHLSLSVCLHQSIKQYYYLFVYLTNCSQSAYYYYHPHAYHSSYLFSVSCFPFLSVSYWFNAFDTRIS